MTDFKLKHRLEIYDCEIDGWHNIKFIKTEDI